MGALVPQPRHYRPIWLAHYGDLPGSCGFCGSEVVAWGRGGDDGVIHHRDEDRQNNSIDNLMLAHRRCHTQHHSTGHITSVEQKAKISASAKQRYRDPAARAKTAVALMGNTNGLGRIDSPETRAKRAAHHIGAKRSPEARERIRAARWDNR